MGGETLSWKVNMRNLEEGTRVQAELESMTADPMPVNIGLLMTILEDNSGTEYGRLHGFGSIRGLDDFRERVPVTTYDDYAGYIGRMTEDGETGLITAYDVIHYAKTSGTMGNPKRIPVTDRSVRTMGRYNIAYRTKVICDTHGTEWMSPPAINLIESQISMLPCGTTYGAISAKVMMEAGNSLSELMTSPVEAMVPSPGTDTRYIHARFALSDPGVATVSFSFSSIMMELMQYIERNWAMLVRDIGSGVIDPSVRMPDEVRRSLLGRIRPMPERADNLRRVFEEGFDRPVMPRIWPEMAFMTGVSTGQFSAYHRRLMDRYAGPGIGMFHVGLNSSEATLSVPVRMDDQDSVLIPDAVFYEFIPVDSGDPGDAVTMDGVEAGRLYEPVITTQAGLYRYRTRDAVLVTGMHNRTPKIRFMYRLDQTVNAMGEKTTELVLREAVRESSERMGYVLTDFSVHVDSGSQPMRYEVLMEADIPEGTEVPDMAADIDARVRASNPSYGDKVGRGLLGELSLGILQPQTYLLYRDLMVSRGASSAQLKPPRVMTNELQVRFFRALLEDGRRRSR